MVFKKYGDTFRRLREQRNISINSFVEVGVSKSALSKFERGESMMGFENVVKSLQKMEVSLEEFEHFLNDYSTGEKETILEEIEKAILLEDQSKLLTLAQRADNLEIPYLSVSIKSLYLEISVEELEEIIDHLYDLEIWSYMELYIFYFIIEHLKTKDILNILDLFLSNGHNVFNSERYRAHFIQAACHAITTLSSRGFQEYAQYIINRIEHYHLITTMFHRNLMNATKGFWVYCFREKQEGKKIIQDAIEIFKAVSTPQIANYYQKRFYFLMSI